MNLGARYWRFSRRAAMLADAFQHSCSPPRDPECLGSHRLARESAAIQLQDQWSSFCRDLVLNSWRGGVVTLSGARIPRRAGDVSDSAALRTLRSTFAGKDKKSKHWEPNGSTRTKHWTRRSGCRLPISPACPWVSASHRHRWTSCVRYGTTSRTEGNSPLRAWPPSSWVTRPMMRRIDSYAI